MYIKTSSLCIIICYNTYSYTLASDNLKAGFTAKIIILYTVTLTKT